MKIVTWIFLCWLSLLSVNAQAEEEALPPEVKSLVGMKIPPKSPGRTGDIPGWTELWGAGIVNSIYYAELQKGNITILAVESIVNQSTTVLDVRVIPGNLLNRYMKDGIRALKKNDMQMYRVTAECWKELGKNEIIVSLWKHEPGSSCTDSSTLVKKAWLLNPENGRLTDLTPNDVSCRETNCGED